MIQTQAATIPLGALIATASLDLKEMGQVVQVSVLVLHLYWGWAWGRTWDLKAKQTSSRILHTEHNVDKHSLVT